MFHYVWWWRRESLHYIVGIVFGNDEEGGKTGEVKKAVDSSRIVMRSSFPEFGIAKL